MGCSAEGICSLTSKNSRPSSRCDALMLHIMTGQGIDPSTCTKREEDALTRMASTSSNQGPHPTIQTMLPSLDRHMLLDTTLQGGDGHMCAPPSAVVSGDDAKHGGKEEVVLERGLQVGLY